MNNKNLEDKVYQLQEVVNTHKQQIRKLIEEVRSLTDENKKIASRLKTLEDNHKDDLKWVLIQKQPHLKKTIF